MRHSALCVQKLRVSQRSRPCLFANGHGRMVPATRVPTKVVTTNSWPDSNWKHVQSLFRGLWSETVRPQQCADDLYLSERRRRLEVFARRSRSCLKACCNSMRRFVRAAVSSPRQMIASSRWKHKLHEFDVILRYLGKLLSHVDARTRQFWIKLFVVQMEEEILETTANIESIVSLAPCRAVCYEWLLRVGAWREFRTSLLRHQEGPIDAICSYKKAVSLVPGDGRAYFAIGCALRLVRHALPSAPGAHAAASSSLTTGKLPGTEELVWLARGYWYIRACLASTRQHSDARKRLVGLVRRSSTLASILLPQSRCSENRSGMGELNSYRDSADASTCLGSATGAAARGALLARPAAHLLDAHCSLLTNAFDQICAWFEETANELTADNHDCPAVHLITAVVFSHADAGAVGPIWRLLRTCCLSQLQAGAGILADYVTAHRDIVEQAPPGALVFLQACRDRYLAHGSANDAVAQNGALTLLSPAVVAAVDDFCDTLELCNDRFLPAPISPDISTSSKTRYLRAALPEERVFGGFTPISQVYANIVDFSHDRSFAEDATRVLGHLHLSTSAMHAGYACAMRLRKLEHLVTKLRRQAPRQPLASAGALHTG